MYNILKMKIIHSIYARYYDFYSRVLIQPDPYFTTNLSFSASCGITLFSTIEITLSAFFCQRVPPVIFLYCAVLTLVITFTYFSSKRSQVILKKDNYLFNSLNASRLIAILFFVISTSYMFIGPFITDYLIRKCE